MSRLDTLLDHVTDIAAILVIGFVVLYANPSYEVLAALVSISLGKKYMDSRKQ